MHSTPFVNIRSAVQKALSDKAEAAPLYDAPEKVSHLNDFVLFMKPEITSQIGFDDFITLFSEVIDVMASHRIHINQIFLLSAGYLARHHILEEHYKAIHDGAKDPLRSFTCKAKDTFVQVYGRHPGEANVLGGWEMLKRYPDLDPLKLHDLWLRKAFCKLDSGMYCSKIRVDAKEVFLVNGFAPRQIAHYTADDRFIILFDLSANLDWQTIRYDFCGTTNPSDAKPGSLRNNLFANQKRYQLEIDISNNGFHVSAGPLEGLKEKMNFLQISDPGSIPFGKKLLQHFSQDEVHGMLSNPSLSVNDSVSSVFNITEDLNSDQALELLMKLKV